MIAEKKVLEDVVVIRLLLILLLVLYHAFAIFYGAWEKPPGVSDIQAYWWVASFSYAFMLEAFVFISGYILGYQTCKKESDIIFSFNSLIGKKVKRLLLPSLFFGSIYYVLFYDLNKPVGEILYTILNGCGHLWFLPMLLWCFVAIYAINKLHLKQTLVFPVALFCSLCSFLPLPLRLSNAMYYFLFFYIGFWCSTNHTCISRYFNSKYVVTSVCLFVGLFVSLTCANEFICTFCGIDSVRCESVVGVVNGGESLIYNELIVKCMRFFLQKLSRIIYAVCGVMMLFITINLFLKKKQIAYISTLKKISTLCFGVYIYQQFILKYLYYHSELPLFCPSIVLPWIGFFISLIGSLLLSWLTLKTRFGRFLIG